MAEFTVGDFDYRSSRMSAMVQMHVVKRFAPSLTALTKVLPAMRAFGMSPSAISDFLSMKVDDDQTLEQQRLLDAAIDSFGGAVGRLSDADAEYVMAACLSLCERRRKGDSNATWATVWNTHAKGPQHADITMPTMMMIAWRVLSAELGGFFPAKPSTSGSV